MFERNNHVIHEQGSVAVEITLDDGSVTAGKLIIPATRPLADHLNGTTPFLEFEPYGDERRFIARQTLRSVRPLAAVKTLNLAQKLRDLDGFDPYTVLGVPANADWDNIRLAYLTAVKSYHPDRYSAVALPTEVSDYLAAMLRRVNAAYAALETARKAPKASKEWAGQSHYGPSART